MKTRPRFLRLMNLRSQWLFTGIGSFFNEIELWWKLLLTLFYFLTSINSVVKLLDSWSNLLFYFNQLFFFSNVVLHHQLLQQILLAMDNNCMKDEYITLILTSNDVKSHKKGFLPLIYHFICILACWSSGGSSSSLIFTS